MRYARRIFFGLWWLPLAVVAGVWVRSYVANDQWVWVARDAVGGYETRAVGWGVGRVYWTDEWMPFALGPSPRTGLHYLSRPRQQAGRWRYWDFSVETNPYAGWVRWLGFEHFHAGGHARPPFDVYSAPLSYIAALAALPPALRAWRKRRAARPRAGGRCAACGYDVRVQLSGAGGNKCPECGAQLPRGGGRIE